MGQYWDLINVDKLKAFGWGKMGEFFWRENMNVIDRLSTPVNPTEWPRLILNEDKRLVPVTQTATLLTKLSTELLAAIAKELLEKDFLDLLSFAMTCVKIWEVTEDIRFEYLRFRLQERSWAGSRIICLGDYARDLPQGLLSEEDMEELEEMAEEMEEKGEEITDVSLLNRSLIMEDRRPWGASGEELIPGFRHILARREYRHTSPLGKTWLSLDLKHFTLRCAPSTSPKDRWMLRNLTKKEFVIRSTSGTSEGFMQVLLSLISWSFDYSVSMILRYID
ncbi:hypothetical protein BDP27DRAFT_1424234 [Rhodocollybia butyracea]|uniref:Uncharacterized protein n=1 Tax=Rhodocollybia butyracea TaxID=206335 RepID=A0A9P5PIL7_9AGAR|nr:hypothetical protein BDP27DRAFT_1424234 [Rhodocollybia butyracea]